MSIPPIEEIEARLARLEEHIRALKAAQRQAENEKKQLLLSWQRQWDRTREHLLSLQEKVRRVLSYDAGDSDMDTFRAQSDDSGFARDHSSPGSAAADPSAAS